MQKIASISLFAFSFWSPKNAYFCSKFLLQNFAFFEKLQKNAPLFSYRKWCIETFNNWLKISYFYCFVLRQKWDKRQSKSPFMKNIIYSLAANYKIAKGSRDRVRESRVRTPFTAHLFAGSNPVYRSSVETQIFASLRVCKQKNVFLPLIFYSWILWQERKKYHTRCNWPTMTLSRLRQDTPLISQLWLANWMRPFAAKSLNEQRIWNNG